MITKEVIENAKKIIADDIYEQTLNGNQSSEISQHGYHACGQFIKLPNRNQRGIHGSAAALRVLADSGDPSKYHLAPNLIKYIRYRKKAENKISSLENRANLNKLNQDQSNVIKISEILYALSFVKPAVANNVEKFKTDLADKLRNSKINNEGWFYFTNASTTQNPKILPTAFAVLALKKYGANIEVPIKYLKNRVRNDAKSINNPTSFAKVIFALYVLTFIKKDLTKDEEKDYKDVLKALIKSSLFMMESDIEQNLEYWSHYEHEYIRVPWQLYLIAIMSRLSLSSFAKVTTQRRLNSIINNVKDNGFRYEQSGPYISTRTNAILFEALSKIDDSIKKNPFYHIYYNWDKFKRFMGSIWVTMPIKISMTCLFVYSIGKWYYSSESNFEDLAPEFIAPILFYLYFLGRKS